MAELSPEQKEALEKQKEQCIFCKIVKGEQQTRKVYEDGEVIAVLDINPAAKGHILLMPKEHYPIMPVIPTKTFENLFIRMKDIAQALSRGLLCQGMNIFIANGAAAGQQSQHFMLHIIPRDEGDNIHVFSLQESQQEEKASEDAFSMLKNNLPIMMNNHFARNPKAWHRQASAQSASRTPQKLTEEQAIRIIGQNPQLMDMMQNNPEAVKAAIPNNPQLKMLFNDADFDSIAKKLRKKKNANDAEGAKDEPDIDDISSLFRT